jgi:plastocyanin
MITMEAKHWFGLVVGGAALLCASFFLNDPKKAWDVPGVRKPTEVGNVVAAAESAPVAVVKTPAARPDTPTATPTAKPAPKPAEKVAKEAPAAAPAEIKATGDLSRNWNGAMIAGTVTWGDKPQRDRAVDVSSDPVCVALNPEPLMGEQYVVDDKGNLANVIVYVDKVPAGDYAKREGEVILDQVGCRYIPHVVGIQLGQKVVIRNSDATTHNVHFKSKLNGSWNMNQSSKGDAAPKGEFARAEVGTALFKCDIHPWMEARVGLFDHPFYAVSKADGTFEIPQGLADGKYTVTAWHEKAKTATATLSVVKGKTSEVNFVFTRKDNKATVVAEGK